MSENWCMMNMLDGSGKQYFLSTNKLRNTDGSSLSIGFNITKGMGAQNLGNVLLRRIYEGEEYAVQAEIDTRSEQDGWMNGWSFSQMDNLPIMLSIDLKKALEEKMSRISLDSTCKVREIGSGQWTGYIPISKEIDELSNLVYAIHKNDQSADKLKVIPKPHESICTGPAVDVTNGHQILLSVFVPIDIVELIVS